MPVPSEFGPGDGPYARFGLSTRRARPRSGAASEASGRGRAPLEVLVVDDDPDLLDSFKDLLELRGFEVWVASDLRSALEQAERHKPAAALIDVKLGQDNGLDAVPELKRIRPEMCCLMMTAYRDEKYAALAFDLGADDFLYKPLNPSALIRNLDARLAASN